MVGVSLKGSDRGARGCAGAARRVVEILRDDGVVTLWFKLLGETVYRRMWLFERPLDAPVAESSVDGDVEFGLVRPDELAQCLSLRPGGNIDEYEQRLGRGEWCYVARRSGRVVGQVWVARRSAWIGYLGRRFDLGADDYYLYEVVVDPGVRGRGVGGALFAYVYRELAGAGAARAVFAVNLDNRAGLRAFGRNGERRFALLGRVGRWHVRYDFSRVSKASAGLRPRTDRAHDSRYWDAVETAVADRGDHYVDDLLAQLKRRAYGRVLNRWAGTRPAGPVLKTDLFEEANVVDALLPELPGGHGDAVGMDISPVVVGMARDGGAAPDAAFVAADVRRLPFVSGSIAMVLSPSTLDHFRDPSDLGRSLVEFKRVLAGDGVLIVTLDNRQNVFDPLLRLIGRWGWLPYYLGRSYTVRELCAELAAAGFEVTDTTTLVQHPRLTGVAATRIANRVGWSWLQGVVRGVFLAAERLEDTRLRYSFGCFVAARAVPKRG